MLLNHDEIVALCNNGCMENWKESAVGAASLDVHLASKILVETGHENGGRVVDYRARERLNMRQIEMTEQGYVLRPGDFILASTVEVCNFPNFVGALFRCKSSMGRIALEHMDAGWVDPGFHGVLTLEFKNMTQYHDIRIRPGDAIGQLIFMQCNEVSHDKSYRSKGNYNGQTEATQIGFK